MLIGTYQHCGRREVDRWRFRFLRIAIRYQARLAVTEVGGQSLNAVLAGLAWPFFAWYLMRQ